MNENLIARPSVGDDPDGYVFTVCKYRQGQVVEAMVCLGNELGLHKAMANAGPLSAGEVAQRVTLGFRRL